MVSVYDYHPRLVKCTFSVSVPVQVESHMERRDSLLCHGRGCDVHNRRGIPSGDTSDYKRMIVPFSSLASNLLQRIQFHVCHINNAFKEASKFGHNISSSSGCPGGASGEKMDSNYLVNRRFDF